MRSARARSDLVACRFMFVGRARPHSGATVTGPVAAAIGHQAEEPERLTARCCGTGAFVGPRRRRRRRPAAGVAVALQRPPFPFQHKHLVLVRDGMCAACARPAATSNCRMAKFGHRLSARPASAPAARAPSMSTGCDSTWSREYVCISLTRVCLHFAHTGMVEFRNCTKCRPGCQQHLKDRSRAGGACGRSSRFREVHATLRPCPTLPLSRSFSIR